MLGAVYKNHKTFKSTSTMKNNLHNSKKFPVSIVSDVDLEMTMNDLFL